MLLLLQAITAMLFASVFAWLELITSSYPQTWTVMRGCRSLWAYAFIYGALAFGVIMGYEALTSTGALQVSSSGSAPTSSDDSKAKPSNTENKSGKTPNFGNSGQKPSWLIAILIGLSAKALLHIRLFTVSAGSQAVPVGTETLVMLFEPWLLRNIELYEFNAVRDFIAPRAECYPDLADVKARIKQRIPIKAADEKRAFEVDVDNSVDVTGAMELYLRSFGVETYNRVFPPKTPQTPPQTDVQSSADTGLPRPAPAQAPPPSDVG